MGGELHHYTTPEKPRSDLVYELVTRVLWTRNPVEGHALPGSRQSGRSTGWTFGEKGQHMADTRNASGGVRYTQAEAGYFEKRSLKRSAGVWGLWGLGVAAVISGDFSGWNF